MLPAGATSSFVWPEGTGSGSSGRTRSSYSPKTEQSQLPLQAMNLTDQISKRMTIVTALKIIVDSHGNSTSNAAAGRRLHRYSGTGYRHQSIVTIFTIVAKLS